MSFTSVTFLIFFLPVCVAANYWMRERYRNVFLCAMSLVFYAWCGLQFLFLILLSATLAYAGGLALERLKGARGRRAVLVLLLAAQLGLLFYYKYFADLVSAPWLSGLLGGRVLFDPGSIVFPLGISFYTFSILSYLLDVYWGVCGAQRRLGNVWLYVLFFPKVVQGPIVRYVDFEAQLRERTVDATALNEGVERFIKGMVKKVMVADQLAGLVSYAFSDVRSVGTAAAWLGIFAYLLQLYYDFSGYSDMALGLGRMLGFTLPENFDHPYMSASVAEYWRRWHITLGAWFRDYVYTPCIRGLTGTRWARGLRQPFVVCDILALVVTWTLTGVWHGSGLNFLAYGLWFCLFIVLERLDANRRKRLKKAGKLKSLAKPRWRRALDHAVTLLAAAVGMVLFRADSLGDACLYLRKMFWWDATDGILFLNAFSNYTVLVLLGGLLFAFPLYGKLRARFLGNAEEGSIRLLLYRLALLGAFLVAFSYSVSNGYAAFLYKVF